jgi:transcriptional regulator with XRE-family HTH domain
MTDHMTVPSRLSTLPYGGSYESLFLKRMSLRVPMSVARPYVLAAMQKRNWNQVELAGRARVDQTTISKWLSPRYDRMILLDSLKKVRDATGHPFPPDLIKIAATEDMRGPDVPDDFEFVVELFGRVVKIMGIQPDPKTTATALKAIEAWLRDYSRARREVGE